MFRQMKTIKYLRALRKKEVNKNFLASLRLDLAHYMKLNPVGLPVIRQNFIKQASAPLFSFRALKLSGRFMPAFIIALMVILSGGGITLAAQSSLPGEALYPVKILSENIRSTLAITPEAKAKLDVSLAATRVDEIKNIITKKDSDPKNLNIAVSRLEEHMADASKIIDEQKNQGKNMEALAKTADVEFDAQQTILTQTFNAQQQTLNNQTQTLGDKIKEAHQSGNAPEADSLARQLSSLTEKRQRIENIRTEADKTIYRQKMNIEKSLPVEQTVEQGPDGSENASSSLPEIIAPASSTPSSTPPADIFNRHDNRGRKNYNNQRGHRGNINGYISATTTDNTSWQNATQTPDNVSGNQPDATTSDPNNYEAPQKPRHLRSQNFENATSTDNTQGGGASSIPHNNGGLQGAWEKFKNFMGGQRYLRQNNN